MSPGRKRLWGIGAVAPLVILVPLWVLALPVGFWFDGKHQDSYPIALAAVYVGLAVYFVTLIAAFIHVRRRTDLTAEARRLWLVGLFVLNGFLLPVFWHRLIRPLPGS